MKKQLLTIFLAIVATLPMAAQTANMQDRALWGSICTKSDVTTSGNSYMDALNKVLLSWRMLPCAPGSAPSSTVVANMLPT